MFPTIVIHGGAADVAPERTEGKMDGVKNAAKIGYQIMQNGGSAIDAVEAAVRSMEDDHHFNAGFGAVLNCDGEVEMCASIMDGKLLNAGAVTLVKDVANPISLARLVMEKTPHVLLAAYGASKFVRDQGVRIVPPNEMVSPYSLKVYEAFKITGWSGDDITEMGGTVGAVAIDLDGNVAAATSTGGTSGKMDGRVGDTCQIGSGTYADNNVGAVSSTGNGEAILKMCQSHSIINDMDTGLSAMSATKLNIQRMMDRLNNTSGAITLSKTGEVGLAFSTNKMPWSYIRQNQLHFGLRPDEHEIVKL